MAANDAAPRDRQWVLTLFPTFPLVLLVLRVWLLSGQDLQTMLVLVQHVSPIGLISTLTITLLWTVPVVILVGYALGRMLEASAPDAAPSWLGRTAGRTPPWVVALAAVLAVFIWQLRFIPALFMIVLMIVGLEVRTRHATWPTVIRATCVGLPLTVAVVFYVWFAPAIVSAVRAGEIVTTLLLLLPPGLTLLLTGPIPARAARPLINSTAIGIALVAPLVAAAIFLRAPVLPTVAIEVDPRPEDTAPPRVVIGEIASVDDTMTTVLEREGTVIFLPNGHVLSKTLCAEVGEPPQSRVDAHGWQVEQTALTWLAPVRPRPAPDARCQGRPLRALS